MMSPHDTYIETHLGWYDYAAYTARPTQYWHRSERQSARRLCLRLPGRTGAWLCISFPDRVRIVFEYYLHFVNALPATVCKDFAAGLH
ncbi:MAG: hypothetical protein OXE78_10780 [Gammaproteobacteria bacterium]|nr:hypothetical protein [Gammaproteobacteria bacterium]